jgi:hypothetical protein
METKVKLSAIVEALELQNDETEYFLDLNSGEVHLLTPDDQYSAEEDDPLEDYPEWQRPNIEVARRLANGEDESLIELPSRWDVNEYGIMETFCHAQPAGKQRDSLESAIQGKGAFRRFKDMLRSLDLFDDWHRFRSEKLKTIAADWCQANEIPFVDDTTG